MSFLLVIPTYCWRKSDKAPKIPGIFRMSWRQFIKLTKYNWEQYLTPETDLVYHCVRKLPEFCPTIFPSQTFIVSELRQNSQYYFNISWSWLHIGISTFRFTFKKKMYFDKSMVELRPFPWIFFCFLSSSTQVYTTNSQVQDRKIILKFLFLYGK